MLGGCYVEATTELQQKRKRWKVKTYNVVIEANSASLKNTDQNEVDDITNKVNNIIEKF